MNGRSPRATLGLAQGVFAILAIVALILASLSTVGAQEDLGSLELVAQSSWVDEGGIFNAQVRASGANPESSVSIEVLSPWESRTDFLAGNTTNAETLLTLGPMLLADVQDTNNEVLSIEIEVGRQASNAGDLEEGQVPLPFLAAGGRAAVYPLQVSLLSEEGESLDSFLTSIIHLPRNNGPVLSTSLVLEPEIGSSINSEGQSTLAEADIANLGVLVDAATQHPTSQVALSITAETLLSLHRSDLDGAEQILDNIREDLTGDQLIAQPVAKLEEQAWFDFGFAQEVGELYRRNSEITEEITGLSPNPAVAVLDPTMRSDGLQQLANFGVNGVLVDPEHVEPVDRSSFPNSLTTRFLIPAGSIEPVPAIAFDRQLTNHFLSTDTVPIAANRLLADLTLLSLQDRDIEGGVVIKPPAGWEPDVSMLNILLGGLERIPSLEAVSPEAVLANAAFTPTRGLGSVSPPLERELQPASSETDLNSFRSDFNQAQSDIDSWSSVIASDLESVNRLNELLDLSTGGDRTDGQRSEFIEQIYTIIGSQSTDSITTPAAETITLTSRSANVPVVIDNNLPIDAEVLLLLDSEKLDFPEGKEVVAILAPGSNRIEVPIEARGSGDSPIRIQVFSPDRSILLGSSDILVRAITVSGVGIVIGGVAIVVLLGWWLRHHRSDRDTVKSDLDQPDTKDSGTLIGV